MIANTRALSQNVVTLTSTKGRLSRFSSSTIRVKLPPFKYHVCDPNLTETETNNEEITRIAHKMVMMRRMELEFDSLYVNRKIRGFLHLYDGQEACAVGIDEAIRPSDDWIHSYRCHGVQFLRCGAGERGIKSVANELFAHASGASHGKGGSGHMFEPEMNFWGTAGIVGAQVPVGTGIAFANKYNHVLKNGEFKKNPEDIIVTACAFGDGAANQGQVWEAANMAKLWNLPVIYIIENNLYGMGTPIERSSSSIDFYKMGKHHIPGIQVDGHNVFAVREAIRYSRKMCCEGNGPVFVELLTYRYHGHSMSDPGITYRTREDVQKVREDRDCIDYLERIILSHNVMSLEKWKEFQNTIKREVKQWTSEAMGEPIPDSSALYKDVYFNETPEFIRGLEYCKSFRKQSQV